MTRAISRLICVGLVVLACLHPQAASVERQPLPRLSVAHTQAAQAQTQSGPAFQSGPATTPASAVVKQYCLGCHNERLKTAGLTLDTLNIDNPEQKPEVWEKVITRLAGRSMPPVGLPRPDEATYDRVVSYLETRIDAAAAARPNPGRTVVHRLNRVEYTNAIRDLLDLEIDGRALLPTDESGYGFDNIADVLSFSPGLLGRYLRAARRVSRLAIGDPAMGSTVETYRISRNLPQEARMSDELPLGSRGGAVIRHYFPADGEFLLRVRLGRNFNSEAIMGLVSRELVDVRIDGERITQFAIGGECVNLKDQRCQPGEGLFRLTEYEVNADDPLQVRLPVRAGMRTIGVSFVQQEVVPAKEGAAPVRPPIGGSDVNTVEQMWIGSVQIEGPFNPSGIADTPSRRRILTCRPARPAEEEPCAKNILGTIARRAYRRPVTNDDLAPLMELYGNGSRTGGFEAGLRVALEGILVAPDFLFRVERAPANAIAGSIYQISDLELASRLSFFLWSSIPDDTLLDLAAARKLRSPGVLDQQVQRMLADARATALVENFVSQWLYLRDLRVAAPDPAIFPDFDEGLRDAFQRESDLFLESQLRDDRPLTELLTADYTYVNERLARFYGIRNVYGSHFRRVALTNPNRRGILGHGSLLTVTSYSTRTSPVIRGKYVLDNLLGAPPPAPPPDIPALREVGEGGDPPTTVRSRLEAHRKNPTCAACHSRMDPIGFALENFNGIGQWRSHEFGAPIDSAGVLPDGRKISGPGDLREALMSQRSAFLRTLTDKLLTYALGRGTEYYDRPAIRKIVNDAAARDYRWSAVVVGIANSLPFQKKVYDGATPPATGSGVPAVSAVPRNQ